MRPFDPSRRMALSQRLAVIMERSALTAAIIILSLVALGAVFRPTREVNGKPQLIGGTLEHCRAHVVMVTWALLRMGDRIAEKTELKFLVRSLTAIVVLVAAVGILALQQVAMEPAFQLEWALGLWTHPPIVLYTAVVFAGTVISYLIARRSRT